MVTHGPTSNLISLGAIPIQAPKLLLALVPTRSSETFRKHKKNIDKPGGSVGEELAYGHNRSKKVFFL